MSHRTLPVLVSLILMGATLAGCVSQGAGEDEPAGAAAPDAGNHDEGSGASEGGDADASDDASSMNESVGDKAHAHDYWAGRERVTIFDEEIEPETFTTVGFTFYNAFVERTVAAGGAYLELPEGSIVYEGTGRMEVTLTWDDPRVTDMGFRYRSAAGGDFSELVPAESAAPATIEVSPAMVDMPHTATSRWAFLFQPPNGGDMIAGPFHVQIDIVKTWDPAEWEGHGNAFEDANETKLLDTTATAEQSNFVMRIADFMTGNVDEEDGVAPDAPVPMRTKEVQARVNIVSQDVTAGEVSNVYLAYRAADRTYHEWARPMEGDVESGFLFYFPVEMGMTDSPYAEESQWRFTIRWASDTAGTGMQCTSCSDGEVEYEIQVTALDHQPNTAGWERGDAEPGQG